MQQSRNQSGHAVAIDIGGTFTDLVAFRFGDNSLASSKSLTTYSNFFEGIGACVDKVGADLSEFQFVKHGTTLVINTLLERTGGPTALVSTKGFRDVLEMARCNRSVTYDLFYRRNPPLVPRHLRFEISERVDSEGKVLVKPDPSEIEALAEKIASSKVEAVGISFLNAYIYPDHEQEVAEALRRLLPDLFVTCGSDLSRDWYEYERTATAAANAYVGPQMTRYLGKLDEELGKRGFSGDAYMMNSGGGVFSLAAASEEPITLVESGPVGGCIGAGVYARELGLPNVISFDMGGTTAKCALVCDGRFEVKSTYDVGGHEYGFPVRGAIIDIVEVGAGGGSIAAIDEQGRMSVGPKSAGSDPGPAAYGKGGEYPTVTDANLLLGRLDPMSFLGGELALDSDAARRVIKDHVALPMGLDDEAGVTKAASGILSIAALTMGEVIKQVALERGRDPREFALFAYGGGGPLHAAELARELHIPLVIIPPETGIFSAVGMLLADLRLDTSQTLLRPLSDEAITELGAVFDEMEAPLRADLQQETGLSECTSERVIELRYCGQVHSVGVPANGIGRSDELRKAFELAYEARFGHSDSVNPVEIVGVRSAVSRPLPRPKVETLAAGEKTDPSTNSVQRPVYFAQSSGFVQTTVYDRSVLPVGFRANGPAVIQEYGSATLVGPEDKFEVGRLGEIQIEIGAGIA